MHALHRFLPALLLLLLALMSSLMLSAVTASDTSRMQAALQRHGGQIQALKDWQRVQQESATLPVTEQLQRINQFFNRRIRFATDQEIWKQPDYWATPMETLAKGAGDCEDFTIAKYFTLIEMGIPVEQLRLIYVKARIGGPNSDIQQAHMVLAYYPTLDAEPLVLDNLITDIRPASRRNDLQPVFSFNSEGIYNGTAGRTKAGAGGVGQLSRWSDLLRRAHEEGFTPTTQQ